MRIIALSLLMLAGCSPDRSRDGSGSLGPDDLVGRWEFQGARNQRGDITPAWMRLTLYAFGVNGDSVFGGAIVYLDVKTPLDDRACGVFRGTGATSGRLNLVIFTLDEPAADMIIDASVRNDSMFVSRIRPRDGDNTIGSGISLVFRRMSRDPNAGCLTRA
jgi:hypothetical protein